MNVASEMDRVVLRDFQSGDAVAVNEVALAAFDQFSEAYEDWSRFRTGIGDMSSLAGVGEIVVAVADETVVGAVAYVGPNRPKASFFRPEWPIMRMLVVSPAARGHGIGKLLAEECLSRARRDNASQLALHTSPVMKIALPMYLRMGFRFHSAVAPIHGVEYNIYVKEVDA